MPFSFSASMTASTQADRSAYLLLKCGFVLVFRAGENFYCAFTSAAAMFFIFKNLRKLLLKLLPKLNAAVVFHHTLRADSG